MAAPSETPSTDLTGKLLIASPGIGDPRFAGTVIFVCAYSDDGSMGLIINRPAPEIPLDNLLEQLDIPCDSNKRDIRVHFGGPVETGRGFVLHSGEYDAAEATLQVTDALSMTASLDILQAMATGGGPKEARLMLGYSGWGPGQLEAEIAQNGWLICDAPTSLVFQRDASAIWTEALAVLGVDPVMLSSEGGRA